MFRQLRRFRKPLTVILGAGASLRAGAPSTDELTQLVKQWSQQTSEEGQLCRKIIDTLQANFHQVNFELIINALEELEPIAWAYKHPTMIDASN